MPEARDMQRQRAPCKWLACARRSPARSSAQAPLRHYPRLAELLLLSANTSLPALVTGLAGDGTSTAASSRRGRLTASAAKRRWNAVSCAGYC